MGSSTYSDENEQGQKTGTESKPAEATPAPEATVPAPEVAPTEGGA